MISLKQVSLLLSTRSVSAVRSKPAVGDLLANGYFPTGDTDATLGDPTGVIPFAENFILSSAAVDAAQTGFDVTMRWRPKQLAFANGAVDFGGFGYRSDEVDFFGGGRVRLSFQALRAATIRAEVNHDEQFNTTGVFSVAWTFGANGGVGGEYAGIGRDLEPTTRNDHIVRVQNEAAFVVNPNTGQPYNVLHVNNLGGLEGSGEGTFERPFLTIAEAEAAGAEDDAIFVATGNGTPAGLTTGIALQDRQLLLGDGGTYGIPDANTGGIFNLATDGGIGPTITNSSGTSVVELADGNRIAGVTIGGGGATNGINGDGVNDLVLEDVNVQNSVQNGVRLASFSGDLDIRDSNFTGNGASGLLVENLTDSTATVLLINNTATTNGLDGFTFQNFDPDTFILNENITSSNLRNGVLLNNFANTAANGLNILNHTADANVDTGIAVDTGNGKLNILAPQITNNGINGIRITDFTNIAGENTIIAGVGTTGGVLDNNGLGGSNLLIELTQPGLMQNVLITDTTVSNGNGNGIDINATGFGTELNVDIRDEVFVLSNFGDGIAVAATESATINANIGNPDLTTAPLQITNNAFLGEAGISILASGTPSIDPLLPPQVASATVNAIISNVAIQNDQSLVDPTIALDDGIENIFFTTTGVDIDSLGNAIVDVQVLNSSIGVPPQDDDQNVLTGVNINLANDTSVGRGPNRILLDDLNVVVGGSGGDTGNVGTGVLINTAANTLSDIVISDSTFRPNGSVAPDADGDGIPDDDDGDGIPDESATFPTLLGPNDGVFGDQIGNAGIVLVATGAAVDGPPIVLANGGLGAGLAGPGTVAAASFVAPDVLSDGIDDNLTRLTLLNNTVRDFTFDGVSVSSFGDAHVLLNISGNTIGNNGAGQNTDTDNDNVFNEENEDGGAANATELTFFDGINIDAFEASTISARISGNLFQDNLERGLSLNTFDDATINAIVSGNGFANNDRGSDSDIMFLRCLSVGGPQASNGGHYGMQLSTLKRSTMKSSTSVRSRPQCSHCRTMSLMAVPTVSCSIRLASMIWGMWWVQF